MLESGKLIHVNKTTQDEKGNSLRNLRPSSGRLFLEHSAVFVPVLPA